MTNGMPISIIVSETLSGHLSPFQDKYSSLLTVNALSDIYARSSCLYLGAVEHARALQDQQVGSSFSSHSLLYLLFLFNIYLEDKNTKSVWTFEFGVSAPFCSYFIFYSSRSQSSCRPQGTSLELAQDVVEDHEKENLNLGLCKQAINGYMIFVFRGTLNECKKNTCKLLHNQQEAGEKAAKSLICGSATDPVTTRRTAVAMTPALKSWIRLLPTFISSTWIDTSVIVDKQIT